MLHTPAFVEIIDLEIVDVKPFVEIIPEADDLIL